jgi:hypothetical protein
VQQLGLTRCTRFFQTFNRINIKYEAGSATYRSSRHNMLVDDVAGNVPGIYCSPCQMTRVNDVAGNGPGRYCSLRHVHVIPFNSRNEASQCV